MVLRMAISMSMILEEIYLSLRKPLCSGRQNLLAIGARIALSKEAKMRLSVLTTDMGRRLEGMYAGPRCWGWLDGFFGRRWRMEWLNDGGGE